MPFAATSHIDQSISHKHLLKHPRQFRRSKPVALESPCRRAGRPDMHLPDIDLQTDAASTVVSGRPALAPNATPCALSRAFRLSYNSAFETGGFIQPRGRIA
jgi:hypothetical protein